MGGKPRSFSFLVGKHLHFDGVSGAAGDMSLGAFVDCGVPLRVLNQAIESVGLGANRLLANTAKRRGITGKDVVVRMDDGTTSRDPYNDNAHKHYPLKDIVKRIESSTLRECAKIRALDMFARLGKAEAKVHGVKLSDVAFHEVGAIDAICDVVGAAAALDFLSPSSVSSSVVCVGAGGTNTSHGVIPIPSPAALSILEDAGGLVTDGGLAMELCTPTGAAILAHSVQMWGTQPPMKPLSSGYGCGDKEFKDRPNVFRVTIGERREAHDKESTLLLEANIDDMTPEQCGNAMETLFEAGALDVWWTSIMMKKNRPGWTLSVLLPSMDEAKIKDILFRDTTTIGLRSRTVQRTVLQRDIRLVETAHGTIGVKVAFGANGVISQVSPEYEDVKRLAKITGEPFLMIYKLALNEHKTQYEN